MALEEARPRYGNRAVKERTGPEMLFIVVRSGPVSWTNRRLASPLLSKAKVRSPENRQRKRCHHNAPHVMVESQRLARDRHHCGCEWHVRLRPPFALQRLAAGKPSL